MSLKPENKSKSVIITRIVEVIPGEEIHLFVAGFNDCRFIAYPKKKQITIPGCQGFNLEEFQRWSSAMESAIERIGW